MPKPRLRIVNETGVSIQTKVLVDDVDISHLVKHIKIRPFGAVPERVEAELTFVGVELDIQGELQGPLITMDVPPDMGDALPFAKSFKMLYEASLANAVAPPAWSSYVFAGRDGTFMVEADEEFGVRVMRKRAVDSPHMYWEEVEEG